jgi:hypothetical protein
MGEDGHEPASKRVISDNVIFASVVVGLEAFFLIIYAIWFEFVTDPVDAAKEVVFYPFFRDICIMIFFGFGFLMAFLRRAGFTAIGTCRPAPTGPHNFNNLPHFVLLIIHARLLLFIYLFILRAFPALMTEGSCRVFLFIWQTPWPNAHATG